MSNYKKRLTYVDGYISVERLPYALRTRKQKKRRNENKPNTWWLHRYVSVPYTYMYAKEAVLESLILLTLAQSHYLTLCILVDFPIHIDAISMGLPI